MQEVMARDSRDRRGPRRPRRDAEHDPADAKEKIDKDFAREMEMRISYFLKSAEQELELEPMNSYRRRMVHSIAGDHRLNSESRGEDRERYVCLIKTPETEAAAPAVAVESAPAAGVVGAGGRGRERLWDYGSQTFTVNPGRNGVRMGLKVDGSVEILRAGERAQVLAERLITAREFRIRDGQLLQPGDPGY
jgi:hypothetical protein